MRIINNSNKVLSPENQQELIRAAINAEIPGEFIQVGIESEYEEGNVWNVMDEDGFVHFRFDDQDNISF
ncbi:MAG: hypothetical protein EBR82_17460 [Caulobacteraceae bacterium]|nr:hypothetical protein [Caulobacteraceae bacterium]